MISVSKWKQVGGPMLLAALGGMVLSSGCLARGARPARHQRMRPGYRLAASRSHQRAPVVAGAVAPDSVASVDGVESPAPAVKRKAPAAPLVAQAESRPISPVKATAQPALRRLVIYSGTLRVQVTEPTQAADKVRSLAESMGGYVQTSMSSQVVVRIPAAKFFLFVKAVGKKVGEVFDKQIRSQDITEEYLDLQIRLKAQLAVFQRLQELLKRAQNVKEAMIVQKELSRLVVAIERLKGRIRYLRKAAALSTIAVFLVRPTTRHRVISPPPMRSPFRWIRRLGISSLLSNLRR